MFRRGGGRAATGHLPNETELLSLGCGFAMMMSHCAGNYSPVHSVTVSEEVKRAGGSTQDWDHNEVRAACALPVCVGSAL